MTSKMTRRWAASGAGIVVAALVVSAAPAAAAKPVKPKKWATSFCTTVIDFTDAMTELQTEVLAGSDEATADVTNNPAAVFLYIDELADGLASAADASATAADEMRDLKKPAVKGGAKLKRVLDDLFAGGLDQIGDEFAGAEDQFRTIGEETDDPIVAAQQLIVTAEELQTTFTELGDTISDSFAALDDDRSIDPDDVLLNALEKAPACAALAG